MRKALFRLLLALIFIFTGIKPVYAQLYKNQFTVTDDNDQYINPYHDRYYTSGVAGTFTHAISRANIKDTNVVKKSLEIEAGQHIYTSYTADAKFIQPNPFVFVPYNQDRPFTAYLFAGASYNWLYANEDALKFNAEIGTIGPWALGRQVQQDFHSFFGLYPAGGWKYQLRNAPGVNLRLDYRMYLYRNNKGWFDMEFNPDSWLGNTFTGASAGLQLRIGELNEFYQSAITNSRVTRNSGDHIGNEFYFFTVPQANYVAYDATIEGGLWLKYKGQVTFGIYHWVYQQQFGLQFASNKWSVNYIAYIRSREVKSSALGDQWASINIACRFGKI